MLGLLETVPQKNSVLIDNATLRSALIALGYVSPRTSSQVEPVKVYDSHITAVETLIESILLHEHLYLPHIHSEDYPPIAEIFRSLFGENVLTALSIDSDQLNVIEQWATDDLSRLPITTPAILKRLRQFAGVDANVEKWDEWIYAPYTTGSAMYEWQIESRKIVSAHLKRLFLGEDKPTKYFLELSEKYGLGTQNYALPHLDELKWEVLSSRAVLWLTYRTCLYDCISWITGIPYVPHPQRASLWEAINLRRSDPNAFFQMPIDVFRSARMAVGNDVNRAAGINVFDLDIPPFFAYVLSNVNSPEDIVPFTLKLRSKRSVVELRRKLWEISAVIHQPQATMKVQKLRQEFEQLVTDIAIEFLIKERPTISPSIQIGGLISLGFDEAIPEGLHQLFVNLKVKRKPHLAFLRDVFKATVDIWNLSNLYDKIFWRNRKYVNKSDITTSHPETSNVSYRSGAHTWNRYPTKRQQKNINFVSVFECRDRLRAFLSSDPTKGAFLALVDYDDFDVINDQNGRETGDQLLALIATAISASLESFEFGSEHYVARTGDTYIVVALGVSATKSRLWRRLLDKEIAQLPERLLLSEKGGLLDGVAQLRAFFNRSSHKPKLSVSVGYAIAIPGEKTSINALFTSAFRKMQAEKASKKPKRKMKKS